MKPRSRTLKLFILWINAEKEHFLYPIRLSKVSKDTIEFNFQGISTAISGLIQCGRNLDSGIQIWSKWENGSGLLYKQVLEVNRTSQGWYCDSCQLLYRSREEMLIKHVFESFLSWCNKDLSDLKLTNLQGVEGYWPEEFMLKDCNEFHNKVIYKLDGCKFQTSSQF